VETEPRPRARCSICASARLPQINTLIASGMTLIDISEEMRKTGKPIKRETIGKHFRFCLGSRRPVLDENVAQAVADAERGATTDAEIDFARMVQRRATQLLASGQMKVTASHGIAAQALLDRRAEKDADRNLALNLARLLSGAMTPAPMVIIEGRAEMMELGDGLAPAEIIER
jgi:hypothetical protein